MRPMIRWVDRLSLVTMGLGVVMMLQKWWPGGFRAGFFVTALATIVQIVTSHLVRSQT